MTVDFQSPKCRQFFAHWAELPRAGLLPHARTFIDHSPYALMHQVMIFEVRVHGVQIRFLGTALVRLWDSDFTDQFLDAVLPAEVSGQIQTGIRTICDHPVGRKDVGTFTTSKGRSIGCEAVCLPLAVNDGQPTRCVRFIHFDDELHHNERKQTFFWTAQPEWIDIGRGHPAV